MAHLPLPENGDGHADQAASEAVAAGDAWKAGRRDDVLQQDADPLETECRGDHDKAATHVMQTLESALYGETVGRVHENVETGR